MYVLIMLFFVFGIFTLFWDTAIALGKLTLKYFYIVIPVVVILYLLLKNGVI